MQNQVHSSLAGQVTTRQAMRAAAASREGRCSRAFRVVSCCMAGRYRAWHARTTVRGAIVAHGLPRSGSRGTYVGMGKQKAPAVTVRPTLKTESSPQWTTDRLAERLKLRRLESNLSLREVSERTGIDHAKISRIERAVPGRGVGTSGGGISVATLVRLAQAYGVSLDYLVGITDDSRPASKRRKGVLVVATRVMHKRKPKAGTAAE